MSHFIPEPRKFTGVTRLQAYSKNTWLKSNLKEIKNLIKNQKFLMDDPKKGYPVTQCMDVYMKNIQYYGSIDKLSFRIVVRGDL